ncbi:MAG: S8 family serine peptidase [Faecousia sp.]
MKRKFSYRFLSLLMAIVMVCGIAVTPVAAADEDAGESVRFEQVDNSEVSSAPGRKPLNTEQQEALYADTDMVRVSIVLNKEPTISRFSTTGIAQNTAAMSYRDGLKAEQESLEAKISREVLNGKKLDVAWNLTLAANLISANVEFGSIAAIEALPEVSQVVIETRYEPAVVSKDEAADPNMATSSSMIGSSAAYAEGFTGAGSLIAVIDTGTDTDHQSFDADAWAYSIAQLGEEVDVLTAEEVAAVLPKLNIAPLINDPADLYLTGKLPFAFNYVDRDLDVTHDRDGQSEHGSHVAGIATANAYIPDGNGGFVNALETVYVQGVAPDAQLLTMKVFGKNGGAYDSDYMVAIEDAILLGADAVNLSLGSAAAGMVTNSEYQDILDALQQTDTVVSISAGNNGNWADEADPFGYLYADDVNFHTGGSPGTYANAFTVASADNIGNTAPVFYVDGNLMFYFESPDYGNPPFTTIAGEHEYIILDSIGANSATGVDDFEALGELVEGKIAMCYRGTSSFYEKANAAAAAGAAGVIIVNNQSGSIYLNLTGYTGKVPVTALAQADGELFWDAAEVETTEDGLTYGIGKMTVSEGVVSAIVNDGYYAVSSFSSRGVPGDLTLKPEITAPGGNIYSVDGATPGGEAYEQMSGTSMAAPQIAGMSALVAQYVKESGLAEKTGLTVRALTQSLLMGTAVPMIEEESGYYWSILAQGAGLANVGNAVKAESFIIMDDDATASAADGKVKAELGDDPERTGEYTIGFTVTNISDHEMTYMLDADLFTQDFFQYGYLWLDNWTTALSHTSEWAGDGVWSQYPDFNGDGKSSDADLQILMDAVAGKDVKIFHEDMMDADGDGTLTSFDVAIWLNDPMTGDFVTIPAGESAHVTVKVAIGEEDKEVLDSLLASGDYVEGYLWLTPLATEEGEEGVQLSIPVLGFYGDWSDASMFDRYDIAADADNEDALIPYLGIGNAFGIEYPDEPGDPYIFGGNPYFEEPYDSSRNALGLEAGSRISLVQYTQIRNSAAGRITVKDVDTGKVIYTQNIGAAYAAYYNANAGKWANTSTGTKIGWDGTGAVDGGNYEIAITLATEYHVNGSSVNWDALGEGATFSIPFTVDNTAPAVNKVVIDDGIVTMTVQDNNYVAAAILFDAYGDFVDALPLDALAAEKNEEGTVTFDASDLELEDGVYMVQVVDYADNKTTYRLFFNVMPVEEVEEVLISDDTLTLPKGADAELAALVLPLEVKDNSVTWTSSDETVATVNEKGAVHAAGVGECVITVASVMDPTKTAECTVTVEPIAWTITGTLQDAEGNPQLFTWNLETEETWTKTFDLQNDTANAAFDHLSELVFSQSADGAMTVIDPETGESEVLKATCDIGGAVDDITFGYYEGYMADEPVAWGVYSTWLLGGEVVTENSFISGFNLGSLLPIFDAQYFTGLTYVNTVPNGDTYADTFLLLTDSGLGLLLAPVGNSLKILGILDLDLAGLPYSQDYDNFYCSLVLGDDMGTLFFSMFDGSSNRLYMIAYGEDEAYHSYLLGDFGEDVWPVTLATATMNGSGDDDEVAVGSVESALITMAKENPLAESLQTVERESLDLNAAANKTAGGLNTASETGDQDETPVEKQGENVYQVVASDDMLNGKITVKFAGVDVLGVSVNGTVAAYNVENGVVTIAFANTEDEMFAAGDVIAEITTSSACNGMTAYETVLENNDDFESGKIKATEIVGHGHKWEEVVTDPGFGVEGSIVRTCSACGAVEIETIPALELPFVDVKEDDYFLDPVIWAKNNGITNGVDATHFAPDGTCERAMIVTMLWRAAGKPAPTTTQNPFVDLEEGEYYVDAVLWAVEKGITNGVDATHFAPHAACTRAQIVTFLWRAAGKPQAEAELPYVDLVEGEYYMVPVMWAHTTGVTNGMDATHFAPKDACTRAQAVTFLYRALAEKAL